MMEQKKDKKFKDAVHGYINIPVYFVDYLIDNKYFQRLRNIEQTGIRVLYPTAKHDRFNHSLGVFYLGQKALSALKDDSCFREKCNNDFDRYEILFLTACLLHDIGHTPFSHSLENQILNNSNIHNDGEIKELGEKIKNIINECESNYCKKNSIKHCDLSDIKAAAHEQLGSYLIFDKFYKNIEELEKKYNIYENDIKYKDDLCFIMRMIMGIKYEEFSSERQVRNCFIELLNGGNFDVDKLDYIMRDTQMSGVNNITVDVERLLSSLCVVTKTKHLNKMNLSKSNIADITISNIRNNENKVFEMVGDYKGIIKIYSGAEIEIRKDSNIKLFKGAEQEFAEITYPTSSIAEFSSSSRICQNNQWLNEVNKKNSKKKIKALPGVPNGSFNVYFENANVLKCLNVEVNNDILIYVFGKINMRIKGKFESVGSLKVFKLDKLIGDISEVEILGDTFSKSFTSSKNPSENGYYTYSIGFKKQAINVVSNVLEARNYLYLWVYAHHKVMYYANFLIPVLSKAISDYCGKGENFPLWELNYNNLDKLDDYYIWTAIRYLNSKDNFMTKYSYLVEQLFSRRYYKSLYKSLAEFELVFSSFTENQKARALSKLRANTNYDMPSLKDDEFMAGYVNNESIEKINKIVEEKGKNIKLTQLLYIVTEFKQKRLDPNKVYFDMLNEILPLSQIPIISTNSIEREKNTYKYFYLYYECDTCEKEDYITQNKFLQDAIKDYLKL